MKIAQVRFDGGRHGAFADRPAARGFRYPAGALFSVLLIVTVLGCGTSTKKTEPWGGLSGTVTLDGKPAKVVTVIFENRERGIWLRGNTDDQGHYEIRSAESAGLPVGDYGISVMPTYHLETPQGLALKGPRPVPNFAVPEKYQDAKTSGLTCSIHEGANQVDLPMKP
jgi:hypothetical protein